MQSLSRRQLVILVLLTLVWGLNWPIMKLGVTNFPALSFRALSMLLGLPVLGLALVIMKVPFRLPRIYWRELLLLTALNMLVWHALIIIAVKSLMGFMGDLHNDVVINWGLLIAFASFAIVGIMLGSTFSKRIPNEKLKPIFGYFVLIMAIIILVNELFLKKMI